MDLKDVREITETITKYVFTLPESVFFAASQLNLTAENLQNIISFAIKQFSENVFEKGKAKTKGTWEYACMELVSFIVSLRLLKLFKDNPLKFAEISEKEMEASFQKIKDHKTQINSFEQLCLFRDIKQQISQGIASDFFTIDIRQKAYRLNVSSKKNVISYLKSPSPDAIVNLKN